jgi:hypothetical protein
MATRKKRQPQLQDNSAQKVAARMAQRRSGERVHVASAVPQMGPVGSRPSSSQPRPIFTGSSAQGLDHGRRPGKRPAGPGRPGGRSSRSATGSGTVGSIGSGGRPAGTTPPTQTEQGGLDTGRRPVPTGLRQPPKNKAGMNRRTDQPLKDRQVKNRLTNAREEHEGWRGDLKELKEAGPSEALTKFRAKVASARYARQEAEKRGIRPKQPEKSKKDEGGKKGSSTTTLSGGMHATPTAPAPGTVTPTPKGGTALPNTAKPGKGAARRVQPKGRRRRRRGG